MPHTPSHTDFNYTPRIRYREQITFAVEQNTDTDAERAKTLDLITRISAWQKKNKQDLNIWTFLNKNNKHIPFSKKLCSVLHLNAHPDNILNCFIPVYQPVIRRYNPNPLYIYWKQKPLFKSEFNFLCCLSTGPAGIRIYRIRYVI